MSDPLEYVMSSPEFAPLWLGVRRRLGVGPARMSMLKKEFVRALSVKDLNEDGGLPHELDAVWHEVVLNTREYAKICQRVRGQFVHHTTLSEMDDDVKRQSRVDKTVMAYRKRFREEPPTHQGWEDEGEDKMFARPTTITMLYIKKLSGQTTAITGLTAASTVLQIKEAYERQHGSPPDQQRLIFAGRSLDDKQTCQELNLQNACTLHLIERLRGC